MRRLVRRVCTDGCSVSEDSSAEAWVVDFDADLSDMDEERFRLMGVVREPDLAFFALLVIRTLTSMVSTAE